MKILKIKNSWFKDSDLRFDAAYHLSDGTVTVHKLKNCPFEILNLKQCTKSIFKGNIFKRVYVDNEKNGFPFLTASDMMKAELKGGKYISKKYSNVDHLKLKRGWILISRSGTLGNTVYTNEDFERFIGTDDLIRIEPDDSNILSGFLYAYLASKYGYGLLTQSGYGGVVQHIEPHHIENLPVPIFPEEKQQEIHQLILEAAELRVEANRLQDDAVSYFNKKYPTNGLTKIFTKSVKVLDFSLAAYNNNLEADKIYSENKNDFFTLNQVVDKCFAPPMFKHIYLNEDNGHPFLTGAELTKFNKKFYRWLSLKGVKNINDYKVKKGTLLLYKSGNTDGGILGNVFIADDILDGACLSDHVIRIFTKDLSMSYWIYAFFKSDIGIRILQKTATGSMIPFITPERLLNLRIPKPDNHYESVSALIEESLKCSVESQKRENQAIALIEKEINLWQE